MQQQCHGPKPVLVCSFISTVSISVVVCHAEARFQRNEVEAEGKVLTSSRSMNSLQIHEEASRTRHVSAQRVGRRKLLTPSGTPSPQLGDDTRPSSDFPSLVPTSTTSMRPSLVPTVESPRPTFPLNACNVCGEERVVTNPDGNVNDTTTNTTYLCALLEQRGNGGFIKPEDCSVVQSLADEPCQCGTTPSPSTFPEVSASPTRTAPATTSNSIASQGAFSRLSLIAIALLFLSSSWINQLT
jgi:hypothetical protein